jgi:ABC-type branched-subunit amino acid transport system substrate-binding protein
MKLLSVVSGYIMMIVSVLSAAPGNNEFQDKFLQGKELYKTGKYGPAMEMLLPVTKEVPGNNFAEYAHYYYALSAFRAGKMNESYQMLLQLIQRYPKWHNIEEAYYLSANVAFELKKYRYGLNFLKDRSPKLQEDIKALKEKYFMRLFPIDSLKAIQKSYPMDVVLAGVLVKRLLAGPISDKDKMLADYLVQEYKIPQAPASPPRQSAKKDAYYVALLFPFNVNEIGTDGQRNNSYVAELYAGLSLAVDSLKKDQVKINLFAYDTEKDNTKISEILKNPELKAMDMIIGPLLPMHNAPVDEFALVNKIVVVSPLSNNSKLIEKNEYVYLFQPSLEHQAQQAAIAAEKEHPPIEKQQVMVFYGDNTRDSLLASYYRDSITARGYKVNLFEQVSKDRMSKITLNLSDSSRVYNVNHVFVASADQVVAANVISALEISELVIPVFTRAEWLQFPLLSFEQLQRRQVYFIFPDYINFENSLVQAFKKAYVAKMNTFPTSYVYTGYELLRFFGKSLNAYGNYFRQELKNQGFTPGNIFSGFQYSAANDNNYVPVVKFEENKLVIVNPMSPGQK